MGDFTANSVAYEVQKSFANKIFSNKTVAKRLIDGNSAKLLDHLYDLIKTFVSYTLNFVGKCYLAIIIIYLFANHTI